MSDFSEYGEPSEEWLSVAAELPKAETDRSVDQLKTITNAGREALAEHEMQQLSSKVELEDHRITGRDGYQIEARTYRSSTLPRDRTLPIYIHFHGGGFLFGTLSSEDSICSRIAIDAEVLIVNVNYRHTPEYQYPTAWDDTEDAFRWVHEHATQIGGDQEAIVVGGVSAGAWLASALTRINLSAPPADRIRIRGQVLMIPCLVFPECYESVLAQLKNPRVSSYRLNEDAPILPLRRIKFFNDLLAVRNADPRDARLNPGLITPAEAKDLPPTTLGIAGCDPLRDEALLYGKLLAENGYE